MPQPFREGAAFGKFVRLSLEVNYVDRLSVENGTACDTPTRARKPNADFLRNRAPVSGRTNVLPIELENGHVVGSAEPRGTLDDNFQHALELGRGGADDPQNLGCRRLLLERSDKPLFQLKTRFVPCRLEEAMSGAVTTAIFSLVVLDQPLVSARLTRNVLVPRSANPGVPESVPLEAMVNQVGPLTFANVSGSPAGATELEARDAV